MNAIIRKLPLLLLLFWLVLVLVVPLLPLNPSKIQLANILQTPDVDSLFGTDDLGRPVMDRLLLGARTSLLVAFTVAAITFITGSTIGLLSGWAGGRIDQLLMRITDVFLAFPGILLAIALAGLLGPGIGNLVVALSIVGWVGFARLARVQVLVIREREHVQAARALGTPGWQIILRHLLPLIAAPLIVEATFTIAGLVIAEAGMSFLGLGVQAPEPSWGSMIRDGARYLLVAPHLVVVPGLALMTVVVAINLLGDQLRDKLDVKI